MSESYIIEIEEPEQIPAVVYETVERGREEEVEVLLDHREAPNVIRGYTEQLRGGLRRPDGGLSWYHNNTGCYMRATPTTPRESKNVAETQRAWGEELAAYLDDIDYPGAVYRDADLYLQENSSEPLKQVVGTSAYSTDETYVERACWYEDDPMDPAFEALLAQDGIDPETFADSIIVPENSLLSYLQEDLGPEPIDADAFISDENRYRADALQKQETGAVRGSCVLGVCEDEQVIQ